MLSTVYKIHTAVLNEPLKTDIEDKNILSEIQAGIRTSRSTTDNIYILQHVIERETIKPRGKLFTFFANLEATFDKVARTILWRTMERMRVNTELIETRKKIYGEIENVVTIGETIT